MILLVRLTSCSPQQAASMDLFCQQGNHIFIYSLVQKILIQYCQIQGICFTYLITIFYTIYNWCMSKLRNLLPGWADFFLFINHCFLSVFIHVISHYLACYLYRLYRLTIYLFYTVIQITTVPAANVQGWIWTRLASCFTEWSNKITLRSFSRSVVTKSVVGASYPRITYHYYCFPTSLLQQLFHRIVPMLFHMIYICCKCT